MSPQGKTQCDSSLLENADTCKSDLERAPGEETEPISSPSSACLDDEEVQANEDLRQAMEVREM